MFILFTGAGSVVRCVIQCVSSWTTHQDRPITVFPLLSFPQTGHLAFAALSVKNPLVFKLFLSESKTGMLVTMWCGKLLHMATPLTTWCMDKGVASPKHVHCQILNNVTIGRCNVWKTLLFWHFAFFVRKWNRIEQNWVCSFSSFVCKEINGLHITWYFSVQLLHNWGQNSVSIIG